MARRSAWLRLPFEFDRAGLVGDLARVRASEWVAHPNARVYTGRWRSVALRSVGGEPGQVVCEPGSRYRDTPVLRRCEYFRTVLRRFDCHKLSVRLMALDPGASIAEHRDRGSSFEDGLARVHIPIVSSRAASFVVDGKRLHFAEGETWYFDADCTHSATNAGSDWRVHLLLDLVPNAWLRQVFDAAGFVKRPPPPYGRPGIDDDNVDDVIWALRRTGGATALALADELESRKRGLVAQAP
ncbi:MAG: aspartyl/asparaginyl beta-hydroxylase domain-containing protein [Myxococcales bacterium FL481]|nr:MAG: aspartyl/asparaginyl beta-hydroxylase domain-containing protein [Myxococcales bacterium FL481]